MGAFVGWENVRELDFPYLSGEDPRSDTQGALAWEDS